MNDLASADANIQVALLEIISEGISGGLLVYDKNDQIVFASPQLETLLPVPANFLVNGTRLRDLLGAIYDSGARFLGEAGGSRRILSREGWVADHIAALWKERSETVERRGIDRWISFARRRLASGYGVCVVRDVSDSRKREEQWRLDAERVQLTEEVLDNLPFPVIVKDDSLTYVAVNKAACRFHGLPADALLGHVGADVHSAELETRLDQINRKVVETGEEIRLTERLTRPDGSEVVIVANKFRIGKAGRHYLVTAMQDVSDLVTYDDQGRGVIPMLEDNRIYTANLRRDGYARERRGAAGNGMQARQVLLVTDHAGFASRASTALQALGADIAVVHSTDELALCLDLVTETGLHVDLVIAEQCLHEECAGIASSRGIPAIGINKTAGAVEIASAISQALRDLSHEKSDVEDDWYIVSDDGSGKIDILVAEDNEVNKIVFSQILEGLGYHYAIAADGEEAVKLWQQRSPKLVLMDITLPRLTGFEASRRIRSLEQEGSHTPIIGVLPQAFERDREECFASGMQDVMLKPISPEALEAIFDKYLAEVGVRQSRG